MKKMAQRHAPLAPTPRRTVGRSAAGAMERQASQLGVRFARGEKELRGQGLIATSAASLLGTGSVGRPLPGPLRHDLEGAFRANLQSVRIHTDPAADQCARGLGAEAFAAGTDIYFAAGHYDPSTLEGRALLGHEMTHVLQQTGRSSHEGRLVATPLHGGGELQFQTDPNAEAEANFNALVTLYRYTAGDEDALLDAIQQLGQASARRITKDIAQNQPSEQLAAFAETVKKGGFMPASDMAKSFLCDALKVMGFHESALALINTDTKFQMGTMLETGGFQTFLVKLKGSYDWAARTFYTHAAFKAFWLAPFVQEFKAFFLQADQSAGSASAFFTAYDSHQTTWVDGTWSTEGDRFRNAWRLLRSMHQERMDLCNGQAREAAKQFPNTGNLERRIRVTRRIRDKFQKLLESPSTAPYLKDLANGVIQAAQGVLAIYEPVVQEINSALEAASQTSDAALLEGKPLAPTRILDDPLAEELRKLLAAQLPLIFVADASVPEGGYVPSSAVYSKRLEAFRNALVKTPGGPKKGAYASRVQGALAKEALKPKPDASKLETLAFLQVLVEHLIQVTFTYDQAADDLTPHFDDERAAHAVLLARDTAQIGRMLGWQELIDAARPFLRTPDQRLYLKTDWEVSEGLPSKLLEDFPMQRDEPILRDLPLTGRHLAHWFNLKRSRREEAALLAMLEGEGHPTGWTEIPIKEQLATIGNDLQDLKNSLETPEQALANLKVGGEVPAFALRDPQRFTVREYTATAPQGDQDWEPIIAAHPKTKLQLLSHIPQGGGYIFQEHVGKPPLVGWLLPDLPDLANFLRKSPALRNYLSKEGPSTWAWLEGLRGAQGANESIDAAIEDVRQPLDARMPALWRRLTTFRRRILAAQCFAKLSSVVGDRPRAVDPRWLWPSQVAQDLKEFEGTAFPQEDRDAQMALLTLGFATPLSELFTETYPYEAAAAAFYPFILLGLRAIDDASLREKALAVTYAGQDAEAPEYLRTMLQDPQALGALRESLQTARDAVETHAVQVRNSRGFQTAAGRRGLVPIGRATVVPIGRKAAWVGGATLAENGEVDLSTGTKYHIAQILEDFTFYPAYGSPTPPGMRAGTGGPYASPRVVVGGKDLPAGAAKPLMVFGINEVERTIDSDDPLLDEINQMVLGRSLQISMANLAALSRGAMEVIEGVATIVFPEAAYAELVVNVAQFLASDEFTEMARRLKDDPVEVLTSLLEAARAKYLNADTVWRFIVLGGQHPLFQLKNRKSQRKRVRSNPTGRLARVIRALDSIASRIYAAIQRVREYLQPPIRAVEGNLMQRPKVVWILQRAIHFIELAADLLPRDTNFSLEDVQQIPKTISENTQHLVDGLSRVELPERIFEPGDLVALIVEFILGRLGVKGKILRVIMDHLPIGIKDSGTAKARIITPMDELGDLVSKGLEKSPLDPNQFWDELRPALEDRFTTLRKDLVVGITDTANGLFNRLNTLLSSDGKPIFPLVTPPNLTRFEVVNEPLDEGVDLYRAPQQGSLASRLHPPLPASGGLPLPRSQKQTFERGFGRDLSHVRLHRDSGSASALEPLQAQALTAGSHVHMNPRLTGDQSRFILAHEVAHVVQQTQPGPPGHRQAPSRGQTGLGIRTNRNLESSADRAARAVVSGGSAHPQDLSPSGPRGVHPAVSASVLEGIIDELTKVGGAGDFTKSPVGGKGRVPGIKDAEDIWNNTMARIKETAVAPNPPGFLKDANIQTILQQHILENHKKAITDAVPGVAQLAQRPLPGARPDSGPKTQLNPGRFVTLLESYIFANTGIAVQISADHETHAVSQVEFTNLHLAWVSGNHKLWILAISNSFPELKSKEKEKATRQREVRQFLTVLGPQPFIWASDTFAFSEDFKIRLKKDLEARVKGAEDVPPYRHYIDHRNTTAADNLSISTHKNLTGRGIGAFQRESHHTTQYLLAEYFGNGPEASHKAFPPPFRKVLPGGVDFGSKGTVSAIRAGSRKLDIAALDPDSGRGNNMPAILLSATCHQKGELHVLKAYDWEIGPGGKQEEHGSPTQGIAIKNRFNDGLPADLKMRNESPETVARVRTAVQSAPAAAEQAIYDAAVGTYHWMYNQMIPALKRALTHQELAYYRATAIRNHSVDDSGSQLQPEYRLEAHHLEGVFEAAKANNDKVMTSAGWPTP